MLASIHCPASGAPRALKPRACSGHALQTCRLQCLPEPPGGPKDLASQGRQFSTLDPQSLAHQPGSVFGAAAVSLCSNAAADQYVAPG